MPTHKHRRRSSSNWLSLISNYENRPVGIDKFCASHDISRSSFIKWRRRLKSKQGSPEISKGFISVGNILPLKVIPLTVRDIRGREFHFPEGFDSASLSCVMEALDNVKQ